MWNKPGNDSGRAHNPNIHTTSHNVYFATQYIDLKLIDSTSSTGEYSAVYSCNIGFTAPPHMFSTYTHSALYKAPWMALCGSYANLCWDHSAVAKLTIIQSFPQLCRENICFFMLLVAWIYFPCLFPKMLIFDICLLRYCNIVFLSCVVFYYIRTKCELLGESGRATYSTLVLLHGCRPLRRE